MGVDATSGWEVAVSVFVADSSRGFLELPRMTTGQRRQARKYIEEQTGLVCESIGIGPERRLRAVKHEAVDETADELFNLEAMIADLLADAHRDSLELPHMTAGQRKQARTLVERHAGLACQSYGFGAERRLLLLKTGGKPQEEPAAPSESTSCRCTSVRLPAGTLPERVCELRGEAGDCCEQAGSETVEAGEADSGGDDSSICSPAASHWSITSPHSVGESTPSSLPEGLEIRNTFICGASDESLDTRCVRSMPHGMFKTCLLDERRSRELAAAIGASAASASEATSSEVVAPPENVGADSPAGDLEVLAPGTDVVIQGLTKLPEFNNLVGTVQSFDKAAGRYDLLLPKPVGPSGQRWAKVKRVNLSLVEQPQPPCQPPTVPKPEPTTDIGTLQLASLLPEVECSHSAGLGCIVDAGINYSASVAPTAFGPGDQVDCSLSANLDCTTDANDYSSSGVLLANLGSQKWGWYGLETIPTWEVTPVLVSF